MSDIVLQHQQLIGQVINNTIGHYVNNNVNGQFANMLNAKKQTYFDQCDNVLCNLFLRDRRQFTPDILQNTVVRVTHGMMCQDIYGATGNAPQDLMGDYEYVKNLQGSGFTNHYQRQQQPQQQYAQPQQQQGVYVANQTYVAPAQQQPQQQYQQGTQSAFQSPTVTVTPSVNVGSSHAPDQIPVNPLTPYIQESNVNKANHTQPLGINNQIQQPQTTAHNPRVIEPVPEAVVEEDQPITRINLTVDLENCYQPSGAYDTLTLMFASVNNILEDPILTTTETLRTIPVLNATAELSEELVKFRDLETVKQVSKRLNSLSHKFSINTLTHWIDSEITLALNTWIKHSKCENSIEIGSYMQEYNTVDQELVRRGWKEDAEDCMIECIHALFYGLDTTTVTLGDKEANLTHYSNIGYIVTVPWDLTFSDLNKSVWIESISSEQLDDILDQAFNVLADDLISVDLHDFAGTKIRAYRQGGISKDLPSKYRFERMLG